MLTSGLGIHSLRVVTLSPLLFVPPPSASVSPPGSNFWATKVRFVSSGPGLGHSDTNRTGMLLPCGTFCVGLR